MKTRLVLVMVMAAMLFACASEQNAADGGDGGVKADGGRYAFVLTTDYTSGSFATVDTVTRKPDSKLCGGQPCQVHSDAIVRRHEGKFHVVNRLGQDNVQIIDPADGFKTIKQYSTGAGSNPQDIAFANGKAYISLQEKSTILVVKPDTGEKIMEIDLSIFNDADGFCEPGQLATDGKTVYAAILRLDRQNMYSPTDKSFIAVIDSAKDALSGSGVLLNTVNPYPGLSLNAAKSELYVGTSGKFGMSNGAVELINTVSLKNSGVVVDAQTLGGDLNHFTVRDGKVFAVISDANFATALLSYDMATKTKTAIASTKGFDFAGFAINSSGEIWISDRTATLPGIRIFHIGGGSEVTTAPIDTGLPPFMLLFTE